MLVDEAGLCSEIVVESFELLCETMKVLSQFRYSTSRKMRGLNSLVQAFYGDGGPILAFQAPKWEKAAGRNPLAPGGQTPRSNNSIPLHSPYSSTATWSIETNP